MNTVTIDDRTFLLPSDWNELSGKQVLLVCQLFCSNLTLVDFRVRALFGFLKLKPRVKGRIAPEDAHFLSKNLDFLLEEVNLMRNPLPVIRCGFRKYFGPSDALLACTFGEFSSACALLEAYNQSKEPQYLDELVAVLYRPGKWFRKIRRRFSDNQDPRRKLASRTLKERIKRISRLDPAVKQAVFLFFSGTLNYLARHFPYVYHPGTGEPFQENNWATLIISLADGRTDDESLDRVTSSNLYNVLIGLNKKAKEYQDYLSQIQSHDRHRSLR